MEGIVGRKIATGKVAEMLFQITEFIEEEFDDMNEKLNGNTKLLEKIAEDLAIIKSHLKL